MPVVLPSVVVLDAIVLLNAVPPILCMLLLVQVVLLSVMPRAPLTAGNVGLLLPVGLLAPLPFSIVFPLVKLLAGLAGAGVGEPAGAEVNGLAGEVGGEQCDA